MTGTITPIGVGTASKYIRQTSAGPQITNLLAVPGNTSIPIIFEPSVQLTNGLPEVWVVATGGKAALIVPGVENNSSFIGRFSLEHFKGVSFKPDRSLTKPSFGPRTTGITESYEIETNSSFIGRFFTERRFGGGTFRSEGSLTRPVLYSRGTQNNGTTVIDFQVAALPTSIEIGDYVEDFQNPSAIPIGTTVTDIEGGVVTFSNPVTVSVGDTLTFYTTNWGGCQVWISTDGNTYAFAGTIYTGGRTGILTAPLASAAAGLDNTNVLSVDLTRSEGQLLSGTSADRDNFVTLCYVGNELISYENAVLTGIFNYNLSSLQRGAYGSTPASHVAGTLFARFGPNDPSLFRYRYPLNLVGTEIFIKLPSFNIFGQVLETLDEVPANSYILTGAGAITPTNVPIQYVGIPQNGTPILLFTFGESVTFAGNFVGSACGAGVMATVSTTFNIAKNGTNFGTMTFGAGGTVASFATTGGSPENFVAGDLLSITPTRTDATLANLSGFLAGTTT